jgi:hypothetical protein
VVLLVLCISDDTPAVILTGLSTRPEGCVVPLRVECPEEKVEEEEEEGGDTADCADELGPYMDEEDGVPSLIPSLLPNGIAVLVNLPARVDAAIEEKENDMGSC